MVDWIIFDAGLNISVEGKMLRETPTQVLVSYGIKVQKFYKSNGYPVGYKRILRDKGKFDKLVLGTINK